MYKGKLPYNQNKIKQKKNETKKGPLISDNYECSKIALLQSEEFVVNHSTQ